MKLGIMQPYFLPYIGYFQLISATDKFVIYDNIKYTKKGWINRNRMLQNGKDVTFSLPLQKDSDYLTISERKLSGDFKKEKLLNQIRGSYSKAQNFDSVYPLVESIVSFEDDNLFSYVSNSIQSCCRFLGVKTEILVSSSLDIDHDLKGQDKVLALCASMGASQYINPIGGVDLYSVDEFKTRGISLSFLNTHEVNYTQFKKEFVPWLSILDVMMFNSVDWISEQLGTGYHLK